MDGKNDHIVQSSMSIVKTEDTCPEYPQNLPRTSLKSYIVATNSQLVDWVLDAM
jgi:hypothetical protein